MSEEPTEQPVEGKTFNEPFNPGEIRIPGGSLIHQPAFLLTQADWIYLKYERGAFYKIAWTCLFVGLGSGITLIGKLSSNFYAGFSGSSQTPISIQSWEWWAPCIAIFLFIVFFIIDYFVPNESKQINKTIDKWFKEAQKHKKG